MSQKETREQAEQEKAAAEKLERQKTATKHYFTCRGECGCTCSYEGKFDGRQYCESCRLTPETKQFVQETKAFDASVQADMERIEAERRSLQFAAKSAKRLDSGRKPMSESPIFGGTAQASLF